MDSLTSDDPTGLRPASASERVPFLDVLRGFALCGVFISNAYMHFGGRYPPPPDEAAPWLASPLDPAVHQLYEFLLAGKAMMLFSFLFGLGFALQLSRAQARGGGFLPMYARRLTVLLLMGVIHTFAFWYGDILSLYAVTGFLLLLFRRVPRERLLVWSGGLMLATPLVFTALQHFVPWLASSAEVAQAAARQERAQGDAFRQQVREVFLHGAYLDTLRANAALTLRRLFRAMFVSQVLIVLGRFLLGFVAGQERLLQEPERHQALLRRLLGWGLLTGVGATGAALLVDVLTRAWHVPRDQPALFFMPMVSELGTMGLAAFYLAGLALLFQREAWRRALCVLAPAGQMALTNYLSQSALMLGLFRGYGWGLGGKLGALACMTLILGLFCLQVGLSHFWLARFLFGPAEWLWRSLTYGTLQPMRRPALLPAVSAAV